MKFQVGDWIRIRDGPSSFSGMIGMVLFPPGDGGTYTSLYVIEFSKSIVPVNPMTKLPSNFTMETFRTSFMECELEPALLDALGAV